MSYVGTLTTFSNGTVLNATDLNNNNTTIKAAVNDNYDRIASLDSVVHAAGFTPSGAYDYFQAQFAATNGNVTSLTATVTALQSTVTTLQSTVSSNYSNDQALFWMGAI